MPIIDSLPRRKITRARFLTDLATATAAFALVPGSSVVLGASSPQDSFLNRLDKFAAKVKIPPVNRRPRQYVGSLEKRVQKEVDRRLKEILALGYKQRIDKVYGPSLETGIVQVTIFFFPLRSDVNNPLKYVVPFFNADPNANQVFGSALSTFSLYGLPDVADDLEWIHGMGSDELSENLVPIVPKTISYNNYQTPDTYFTKVGVVRVEYRPSSEAGLGTIYYDVRRRTNPKSDKTESLLYTGRNPGKEYLPRILSN